MTSKNSWWRQWRKKRRYYNSCKKLNIAIKKNKKAKAITAWIKENPHIHLLNYPYYRILKWLTERGE